MTDYESPSGQPYSGPTMTRGEPRNFGLPAKPAVHVDTTGSPRWLQIVRDVLISVAALLFIAGAILTAVALNRAGNALNDIGNSNPSPTPACFIVDDPTCVQPGD